MIFIKALLADELVVGYDKKIILDNINVAVPKGEVTILIGSNGSGKSTLLKCLSRILKSNSGDIYLNDKLMAKMTPKEIAKDLSMLPQTPVSPEGITVMELVKQGRYPHKKMFKQFNKEDNDIVLEALKATNTYEIRNSLLQDLSGGQRQRVWIAMTLAQDTDIIFLDEPTTYLDLAHQIDILDLLEDLNKVKGKTIVMVLHDLNLAARYGDNLIVVSNKGIYDYGSPEKVITKKMLSEVFDLKAEIVEDCLTGTPVCVPYSKRTLKNII